MAISHGEITLIALHVERQGANLLNGIDAEQYIARPTPLAQARHIQAKAAAELHGADRQQACAPVAGRE
ncbi:hypothetical protein D3C81_2105110 [compost metagenome]